jgi:hypothetical protein
MRNTSIRHKIVLYGVWAILCMAMTAQTASAYTFSGFATVYDNNVPITGICVQGQAGIDHFVPGFFSGNLAYADTRALSPSCGGGLTKPNGSAAVRLDVEVWTGTAWAICRSTDWTYGATGVNQWGPWGPSISLDYGGASSCGPGYYRTRAYSYIWHISIWRGGSVVSGYEYVE